MRIAANVVLLILSGTLITSCKDDDDNPSLPPITTTGANTSGCRIDGEVYVPKGSFSGTRAEVMGNLIVVYGVSTGVTITLKVQLPEQNDVVANKTYGFAGDSITCEYLTWTKTSNCSFKDNLSGSITFTKIDQQNLILSGVFEFSAFSTDCSKSVKVTDGRFDIRLDD